MADGTPSSRSRRTPFDLGPWRIDPGVNWICHLEDGRRIPLEPKALELLVLLADHAGHTLSKTEILDTVWAGVSVVDTVVPKAMSALRQALGDDPKNPQFIQTIQRKGYRLVVPVRPVEASTSLGVDAGSTSLPIHPRSPLRKSKPGRLAILGGVAFLLVLTSTLWVKGSNPSPSVEPTIERLVIAPFRGGISTEGSATLTAAIRSEILTELARFESPRVFPIDMNVGPSETDLDLARDVGADALLEGEVSNWGQQIRIDLSLIDTQTGRSRWSMSVERPSDDLWSIRKDVALALTRRLNAEVHSSPRPTPPTLPVPQAVYRRYLEARALWNQRSLDGLTRSRDLFFEVTQQAPDFAEGFAWLAIVEVTQSIYLGTDSFAAYQAAESASTRALDLAPDEPMVQIAAGLVALNGRADARSAIAHYQKALEIAPYLTQGHQFLAEALSATGRHEDAIAAANAAVNLDPISPLQHGVRSIVLNAAGRWPEAIEAADHALLLDGQSWILRYRSFAQARLGDNDAAVSSVRQLTELRGESPEILAQLDRLLERKGLEGYWLWLRDRFEFLESIGIEARPMDRAEVLAATGETEEAIAALRKAVEVAEGACFLQLRVSPAFDSIRQDPRFIELYESVGSSVRIEEHSSST